MTDTKTIIEERGQRYGQFSGQAQVAQAIKKAMQLDNPKLADDQREALEMIANKIGRIINGDPDYADSWVDIAGYAQLVADRLQKPSAQKKHKCAFLFMGTPITELSEAQKEKCIDWIAKEAPVGWYYLLKAVKYPETLNEEDIEHLEKMCCLHSNVMKVLIDD